MQARKFNKILKLLKKIKKGKIKHAFMQITVIVVSEDEYNKWLEEAKFKFAKEEINNKIKVAKKIKEIK